VERLAPLPAVDQVIPVRDDVVDRAAVVAERDAAVHAARALLRGLLVVQAHDELAPVLHALGRRLVGFLQALEFQETGDFTHDDSSASSRASGGDSFGVGRAPQFGQGAAILDGHDLDEATARVFPVAPDVAGAEAARIAEVVFHQAAQDDFVRLALAATGRAVPGFDALLVLLLGRGQHGFEFDHGKVAALAQPSLRIPDVGHAARHAGGK